jgi:hypothetical protein
MIAAANAINLECADRVASRRRLEDTYDVVVSLVGGSPKRHAINFSCLPSVWWMMNQAGQA